MAESKDKKISIKRRDSVVNKISLNLNFKKIGIIFFSILILVVTITGLVFFLSNYKADRYQINSVNFINKDNVSVVINSELNNETFLKINTSELEKKIKSQSKLIKEAKVSKSIFNGIIVDIVEYEPIVILKTVDGKKYFVTKTKEIIEFNDDSEKVNDLPEFNYVGNDLSDDNIFILSNSAKSLLNKLNGQVSGSFNFDNFGNLFILLEGNRVIRFDLNERFFTLDDQVKLLHDAMVKDPSFSEINIQFSYLVIK